MLKGPVGSIRINRKYFIMVFFLVIFGFSKFMFESTNFIFNWFKKFTFCEIFKFYWKIELNSNQ